MGEVLGFETELFNALEVWAPVESCVSETVVCKAGWLTLGGVLCVKGAKLEPIGVSSVVVGVWLVSSVSLL